MDDYTLVIDPAIYCPDNWVKLLKFYGLTDNYFDNYLPLHPTQHYFIDSEQNEVQIGDKKLAELYDQLNRCPHSIEEECDCECVIDEDNLSSNIIEDWNPDLRDAIIQRSKFSVEDFFVQLREFRYDFLSPLNNPTNITGIDYSVGLSLLTKISKRGIEYICSQPIGIQKCIKRYGVTIKPIIEQCRIIQQINNVLNIQHSWDRVRFTDEMIEKIATTINLYQSRINQYFDFEIEEIGGLDVTVYILNLLYWNWSGIYFVPNATHSECKKKIISCVWHTASLPPSIEKITNIYINTIKTLDQ